MDGLNPSQSMIEIESQQMAFSEDENHIDEHTTFHPNCKWM